MTSSSQFLDAKIQDQPVEQVVEEEEKTEEVTMDELISSMITLSSYVNHLYTQTHLLCLLADEETIRTVISCK